MNQPLSFSMVAVTVARLLGVIVLMILAFFISAMLFGVEGVKLTPQEQALSGQLVILFSAVNALILSYWVLRSRWHGWKLIGSLFLLQFGIVTFMSQIETLVFNNTLKLPMQQLIALFVTGFFRALIFAPLAVLILGKAKAAPDSARLDIRLDYSIKEWAARLSSLAVIYAVVYFVFGYFVAWQSPGLRQFYSGSTEILPFTEHLADVFKSDPWLVLIQIVRGYLWVLVILPAVRMLRGGMLETSLALAVTLAVLLSDFILLPNPYMPEVVRMAHFTELWSSMAVFGLLAGVVLLYRRRGAKSA